MEEPRDVISWSRNFERGNGNHDLEDGECTFQGKTLITFPDQWSVIVAVFHCVCGRYSVLDQILSLYTVFQNNRLDEVYRG